MVALANPAAAAAAALRRVGLEWLSLRVFQLCRWKIDRVFDDLVISADTAAVHLASALDIPVVGLYGPNTPALYGPWGSKGIAVYQQFDCSPCITNFNAKLHTCRHPAGRGACMRAIEVADVLTAIQQHYFSPTAPCRLKKLGGD